MMKTTTSQNGRRFRRFIRGFIASAGAFAVLSGTFLYKGNTIRTEADSATQTQAEAIKTGYTMKLIEWRSTTPRPGDPVVVEDETKGVRRMLIYYNSANEWYYVGYDQMDGSHYWKANPIASEPYVTNDGSSFLTKTLMGAPVFTRKDFHKSRPRYTIEMVDKNNNPTGYYLEDDGDDIVKSKKSAKWVWDTVIAPVKTGVHLYWYDSTGADTHIVFRGSRIAGDEDDWNGNVDLFSYELRPQEVTFAAIGDYTVGTDQVPQTLRVQNNTFLLDDKTLKITEGSVLNVDENFLYNGNIIVEGTLIVQKNATMTPYEASGAGGNITLKNGGTLIIMPGGRVCAGLRKGILGTTQNATVIVENGNIINYGLFAANRIELRDNAVVENHEGGRMLLGYGVEKPGQFKNKFGAYTISSDLGATNTGAYVKLSNKAMLKVYYNSGLTCSGVTGTVQYVTYDKNGKMSSSVRTP